MPFRCQYCNGEMDTKDLKIVDDNYFHGEIPYMVRVISCPHCSKILSILDNRGGYAPK